MPKKDSDQKLNATQGTILGFLMSGPSSGWDLMREIRNGLQRFWNITQSHVYRELTNLTASGLLSASEPGAREKKIYRITRAGRTAFAQWIATPPEQEQIRNPLLIRLWFAEYLDTNDRRQMLSEQRELHQERLSAYSGISDDQLEGSEGRRAVLRYGIFYEEAMLEWLAEIERGDTAG